MKSVFYLDREDFIKMTVEKVLKRAQIECFTTSECDDADYLIKDLKPDLVLFDLSFCYPEHKSLIETLMKDSEIPFGTLAFEKDLGELEQKWLHDSKIPFLLKPLKIESMIEDFKQLQVSFKGLRS